MKSVTARLLSVAAGVLVSTGSSTAAEPIGTAFTYQGQLKNAGVPLTGTADLEFSLWDGADAGEPPAGGSQIGPTVHVTNVAVTNGLFSVELDFGASAFAADARWLQVAVRSPHDPGDTQPFTTLAPRQALTPAPFALATRGISPRQVSALEVQSSMGGFVNMSNITACLQTDEDIKCDEVVLLDVALHEGVEISLELVSLTSREEALQLEIEKRPQQSASSIKAFTVDVKVTLGSEAHEFSVSPADPIYGSKHDSTWPHTTWDFVVWLADDTHLRVATELSTLKSITTESAGAITAAQVETYGEFAQDVNVTVSVTNIGDYRTNYIVMLTDCASTVDPVPAQARMFDPEETVDFVFNLHNSAPFGDADQCTATIKQPHGKIYPPFTVDFPPPTAGLSAPAAQPPPQPNVDWPPAARTVERLASHQPSVDVINARRGEMADLKARLEELEALVEQLRSTREDGE